MFDATHASETLARPYVPATPLIRADAILADDELSPPPPPFTPTA